MQLSSLTYTSLTHSKLFFLFAGFLGCDAVLFGAWSSHALSGQEQEWAEIALRYQFIHTVALFALGIWFYMSHKSDQSLSRFAAIAGYLWIIGVFLFSGNLALKATTDFTALGFLTPFGGMSMALGWVCILISALKLK